MLAFFTGLLLGAGHALSGPDHLAAVAPLSTTGRAWRVGLWWGAGHGAGVGVVALALWWLGQAIGIDQLAAHAERVVAASLIAVGAWMLFRRRHASAPTPVHSGPAAAVGLLHGVAGSAHVYAAAPAVMLGDGVAYLGGFACGAVLAMGVFAGVLGRVVIGLDAGNQRRLGQGLAALTILVGLVWLWV